MLEGQHCHQQRSVKRSSRPKGPRAEASGAPAGCGTCWGPVWEPRGAGSTRPRWCPEGGVHRPARSPAGPPLAVVCASSSARASLTTAIRLSLGLLLTLNPCSLCSPVPRARATLVNLAGGSQSGPAWRVPAYCVTSFLNGVGRALGTTCCPTEASSAAAPGRQRHGAQSPLGPAAFSWDWVPFKWLVTAGSSVGYSTE